MTTTTLLFRSNFFFNKNLAVSLRSIPIIKSKLYFSTNTENQFSIKDSHNSIQTKNLNLNIQNSQNIYDVIIVGGGVTGTSLLYYLTKFSDLKKIGLCERRNDFAMISSAANNNSQTIHCGDIETNYSLSKAKSVKKQADMLRNYISKLPQNLQDKIAGRYQKMVLGIGENECSFLEDRIQTFKEVFPSMKLVGKSQLAEIEPRCALLNSHNLRPEEINAILIENEHVAINYKELSDCFIKQVNENTSSKANIFLNTEVTKIIPESEKLYTVKTNGSRLQARFVVVSSCGYSLLMAHRMGYGLEYSCLPVSGSFYFTPQMLNGKVYTIQNPELPFAAIHGDPDLVATDKTRFGPTALPLPLLERYNNSSLKEFLEVLKPDLSLFDVYWKFLKNRTLRNYLFRNFLFELPLVNTLLFLKDAQKIIPSMKQEDLTYAHGFGGIRPQLVNKNEKKLVGGEGKISPLGQNLIFNITPSPGGTTCIGTAHDDAIVICKALGATLNEKLIKEEILLGEYSTL